MGGGEITLMMLNECVSVVCKILYKLHAHVIFVKDSNRCWLWSASGIQTFPDRSTGLFLLIELFMYMTCELQFQVYSACE